VILECDADGITTTHVAGWIASHQRLGAAKPYVGSPLAELDLAGRSARNQSGRLIELAGEPLPMDEGLLASVEVTIERAQRASGLPEKTAWKRLA
jgi:hypothetical protein